MSEQLQKMSIYFQNNWSFHKNLGTSLFLRPTNELYLETQEKLLINTDDRITKIYVQFVECGQNISPETQQSSQRAAD